MRVLIFVLLGLLVLGTIVHGIRLLWHNIHPDNAANDEKKSSLTAFDLWAGRVLLYGLLLLFMLLALERGLTNYAPPPNLERPPTPPKPTAPVTSVQPSTVPGRYY